MPWRRVDTAGHHGPARARATSRIASTVAKPNAPAPIVAMAWAATSRSKPISPAGRSARTVARVQQAHRPVQGHEHHAGEHAHRRDLGADDGPARNRQRAEDRLVALVEHEVVPGDDCDQRQQDHRGRDEEEEIVDGADGVAGRHREERHHVLGAHQHGDERARREQAGEAQRRALVRVGLRRHEVVVEQPRDEMADQELAGSHPPPRRRHARSARDRPGSRAR